MRIYGADIKMQKGWCSRVSIATSVLILALYVYFEFFYVGSSLQALGVFILLIVVAVPCFAVIDACTHLAH